MYVEIGIIYIIIELKYDLNLGDPGLQNIVELVFFCSASSSEVFT